MRKTYQELEEAAKSLGTDRLWSWSKYKTYKEDKFTYYLKYVKRERPDRQDSIYAVSGGQAHDIIERFYKGEINYSDMIDKYESALLNMTLMDMKYDRTDEAANSRIADKYESCIKHFFTHHNVINGKNTLEDFITIKISDDIYFQGYVDFSSEYTDENGDKHIDIIDWKTSTKYTGKKIDDECGQLLLYAEGIHQITGLSLEHIHPKWNFMKYVNVSFEQANGKWKKRAVERNQLFDKMKNTIEMWYDKENEDESVYYLINNSNVMTDLPERTAKHFRFDDCYIDVPLSEDKINTLKKDIVKTLTEIREKESAGNGLSNSDELEKLWWQDVTNKDEYRLAVLSEYSRKKHKPYDEYLKNKEMFTESKDNEVDDEILKLLNGMV